MNEAIQNMLTRRSVRKYKQDKIPKEILDEIIKAGTYAPTGKNRQAPIILAITNKEIRDKLSKLAAKVRGTENIDPFYGAPIVLVVLAKKEYITYLALDGDRVVGFIGLMKKLNGSYMILDLMQVSAEVRGHGIGRKLFDKGKEEARKAWTAPGRIDRKNKHLS